AVARDGEGLARRPHMHIKTILRNIDANILRVHPDPSLFNRARVAAHTTVRDRWIGNEGAALSYGLSRPRMSRPPHCHRTRYPTRCGRSQLTRMREIENGLGQGPQRKILILSLSKDATP